MKEMNDIHKRIPNPTQRCISSYSIFIVFIISRFLLPLHSPIIIMIITSDQNSLTSSSCLYLYVSPSLSLFTFEHQLDSSGTFASSQSRTVDGAQDVYKTETHNNNRQSIRSFSPCLSHTPFSQATYLASISIS